MCVIQVLLTYKAIYAYVNIIFISLWINTTWLAYSQLSDLHRFLSLFWCLSNLQDKWMICILIMNLRVILFRGSICWIARPNEASQTYIKTCFVFW